MIIRSDQDSFGRAGSATRSEVISGAERFLKVEFDLEQKQVVNEATRNLQVIHGATGCGKTCCLMTLASHAILYNYSVD